MEFNSYKSGDENKTLQERLDERAKQIRERESALPAINMSEPLSTARSVVQPEEVQEAPAEEDATEVDRKARPHLYNEDGSLKPLSERIADAERAKESAPHKETAQDIADRVEAEFNAREDAKRSDEKDEGFWGTVSSIFTGEEETEYNREYTGAVGGGYKEQVLAETTNGSYDLKEGEYTQNDLYRNDEAFNKVFKYMEARYGLATLEGKSREEIVDRFLNNRRGTTSGNSARVLSELTWSIKATEEAKEAARDAYALFDGMGGVFGKNTTFAEKAEGLMDYTRSAVADPVNLLGPALGIGKVGTGTGLRAAQSVAKTAALKEGAEQVAKGATREIANEAAKQVYKTSLKTAQESAELALQVYRGAKFGASKKSAMGRLLSRPAMVETAKVTGVDAITQGVAELMNQTAYTNTEYQDRIDMYQVGLTTLFAAGTGVATAGVQLLRGRSRSGIVPSKEFIDEFSTGKPKVNSLFKDLSESLKEVRSRGTGVKLADDTWSADVDLGAIDGSRFNQMLYGVADKEGNIKFKGLTDRLFDAGLSWDKDKETITQWIVGSIKGIDDKTAQELAGALGIKNAEKITAKEFSDVFETKITEGARAMASMSAAARKVGKPVEELTPTDTVHAFFQKPPVDPKKPTLGKKAWELAQRSQDGMIRAMVTHPGTTYRNVVGFAGVTGINTATEMVSALLYGTRGALGQTYDALTGTVNPNSAAYLLKAKNTILGLRDQFSFMVDPSMTRASFDSHLTSFGKEMEALAAVRAGGIDTGSNLNLDSVLSFNTNRVMDAGGRVGEFLQTISLVTAQDDWSKSLSFTTEMNKQLRDRFGVGMREFYSDTKYLKHIDGKLYKEAMVESILKAQDETFSRSFKGKEGISAVAGLIEDARKIPVVGSAIPFGRFFNNTINFVKQNSVNPVMGILGDSLKGSAPEIADLSRVAVVGGLLYAYADDAYENIEKGLGMFQKEDSLTGDTKDVTFDYPHSMFRALGYYIAKRARGENLTANEADQLFGEAFGGSIMDSPKRLFEALGRDYDTLAGGGSVMEMTEFLDVIGSQYISSFTRFADPYNTLAKAATGQSSQDKTQYDRPFVANSLRYLDAFVPTALFGGESSTDYKAAEGGQEANASGRILGTTNLTLTNTQRVMNMVGVKTWEYESEKKLRDFAPGVANEMNRLLGIELEERSTRLMSNPRFRNASQKDKETLWKMEVTEAKAEAKLEVQYGRGKHSYMDGVVYKLVAGYSRKDLAEGFEVIGVPKDSRVEDLTDDQVFALEDWLQVADRVNELEASAVLRR